MSWTQYLRESIVPREKIDNFLQRPTTVRFDSELGYVLHNSLNRWGVDGSQTIATSRPSGARTSFLYADRKPRINCYGNSFTEGTQVSDGETWQEYLAAHFGEPVGNYGVGGHGVFQAYRRMLRQEQTDHSAEYIVLYVWGDDPTRSLMRCRWAANYYRTQLATSMSRRLRLDPGFSGNPWAHIEMDLSTGKFVERENPLSTPESLYQMCDPEWMIDYLGDDIATQLVAFGGRPEYGVPGKVIDLNREKVSQLAEALDFRFEWSAEADLKKQAAALLDRYGQRATNVILDKTRAYTESKGKKLLVVLNFTSRPDYWSGSTITYDGTRRDQEILDHLAEQEFAFFDMNEVHEREYRSAAADSFHEYIGQYQVGGRGHYSPRGNHFFAYSIKDTLVEMLDPKPLPYRDVDPESVDFSEYLTSDGEVH